MISVKDSAINELELLVVLDHLEQHKIETATIRQGKNCVWVALTSGINQYYIFNQGQLVDLQVD